MDGMGQVIVALLLLLIAPQPGLLNNDDSGESPEAIAIDKEIEDAMENMQALFEGFVVLFMQTIHNNNS